jgi:chloride channel protein, CIC family
MVKDIPTIPAEMRTVELAARIAKGDSLVTSHQALPIVDDHGDLTGIITRGDLLRALEQDPEGKMSVLKAGTAAPVVTYPDELLYDAAAKMLRIDVGRLPVVSRQHPKKLVGYLGRSGVLAAHLKRLEEEHVLEPGWWGRFRDRRRNANATNRAA